MKHRHLAYEPDIEIASVPSAALVDLFERGDLADWQPVLAAISREPRGDLARRVVALLDRFPMYGTSPLVRAWIDRVRAAERREAQPGRAVALRELRRRTGLTQTALAARMDMSQSDLSKLERRADVRVSTLRSYVEALGGSLALVASLEGARLQVHLGRRAEPEGPRPPPS